jgi:hypothetical protein
MRARRPTRAGGSVAVSGDGATVDADPEVGWLKPEPADPQVKAQAASNVSQEVR